MQTTHGINYTWTKPTPPSDCPNVVISTHQSPVVFVWLNAWVGVLLPMLLYAACTTFAWSCACLLRVDGDALASWYNVYHSPTIPISLPLHCPLPTTLAPSLHLRHVVAVVPRRLLADSACGLRVFCEASAEPEDWLKETLWCKKNWQMKITKRHCYDHEFQPPSQSSRNRRNHVATTPWVWN